MIDEAEEEEKCDVCKAIKDLIEDGTRKRDRQLIQKWFQKGKTILEMAEDFDKPGSYVLALMS